MKKIYTAIDIGSFSIKMIVCEEIKNKFHVLALSNVRSKGIQKGQITDVELAKESLLKAKKELEQMLGITINQAIVSLPSFDVSFDIVEGTTKLENIDKKVTSDDIANVFQDAVLGKVEEDRKLITITPISFKVDNKESVSDPKDLIGENLSVKAVITTSPKDLFKQTINFVKECGIEVVDVTYGIVGDYYEARNHDIDTHVSAIVNIGYQNMNIAIFNKGIMIKNETYDSGSKLIDNDLCYMYKIKRSQARHLKETFAVSNTRYSDVHDTYELTNKEKEKITLNQLEVSEVVESRIVDLLKLAKKQINLLTNREIGYIIITGGISELAGFEYVVENVFDRRCSVLNINTMGIRNNMYSSCYGIIKYFHNKLDLRGISYSMIDDKDIDNLLGNKSKTSNNILEKVFGYFS